MFVVGILTAEKEVAVFISAGATFEGFLDDASGASTEERLTNRNLMYPSGLNLRRKRKRKMSDYNKLKEQVRSLNESYIRLSTQLDGLVKQEQQEIDNLRQLGVVDLEGTIAATTEEVKRLEAQIEQSLVSLGTVAQ